MHRFFRAEGADHSVATLCRVLGVSRAGFYAAERRPVCNRSLEGERILEAIKEIHADSRETYGRPASRRCSPGATYNVGRKRVGRLMLVADQGRPPDRDLQVDRGLLQPQAHPHDDLYALPRGV